METNNATLFGKMAAVMGSVRTLEKTGRNTYDKYDYVTADAIAIAIGREMAKQKLVLIPSVTSVDTTEYTTAKGGTNFRTVAHMDMTLACGDTGATWSAAWVGEAIDRSDKSISKAIVSATKYFLLKTFLLAGGDDDADAETPEVAVRAATSQHTANSAKTQQRPAERPTEAVEHASEDEPPLHQWVYDKLDGKCAKFADWSRTKNANSSGPATPAMYQYLAGVLDGISGNTTHKEIMAVLVGRPVNQDNPPGYDLVSQLLDWLPETVGKGEEKQPNPKHEAKYVPCIRAIGELVLQAQGQTSLFG